MKDSPGNILDTISDSELLAFFKATEFFKMVPEAKLLQLMRQFESVHIHSGETLIKQGDKGDCLFVVLSGRLTTVKEHHKNTILNEIGRGELIGELALLTQEPRAATVIAIRDSILLKLSQDSFNTFLNDNPLQVMPIVRSAILRVLNTKNDYRNTINTVAIVGAGANASISEFAAAFAKELSQYGSTLHLNSQTIKKVFLEKDIKHNVTFVNWLNKMELEHHYIVYETDHDNTEWTRRCLRQADRILLVAESQSDKSLNFTEGIILKNNLKIKKYIDLVLLYDDNSSPTSTKDWLSERKVHEHHHIKKTSLPDMHRLIRIITGQAIALVLGGGGARALGHIGVYKALTELGIPVDLVGGTSFGAVISGFIAMGISVEQMVDLIKKHVIGNKKIFSFHTIPFLAINSGWHLTESMRICYGDHNHIEDLWRKFFCIGCNLTTGKPVVIKSGLTWKAIRTSVSLPVVFPPVTNADHDVLVDGGIINNLPVDVMRQLANGGKVIAVSTSFSEPFKADIPEGILSGWDVIYQRYFKKDHRNFPNIAQIILKSIGVSSGPFEKKMQQRADVTIQLQSHGVDLLDFKSIDELIEIGYQTTMEKFTQPIVDKLISKIT